MSVAGKRPIRQGGNFHTYKYRHSVQKVHVVISKLAKLCMFEVGGLYVSN